MTDPREIDPLEMAQVVLVRLGEFIRKLSPEVVKELYEGTAKIEVVSKKRQPALRKAASDAAVDAARVAQIRSDLAAINDQAAAATYIRDLRLKVADLKALANHLGVPLASRTTKDKIVQDIAYWTVGRRLDSEAISRPAPSRF